MKIASSPPVAASWLLEKFSAENSREALAGDLLEEFRYGRGAPWYWRQVMAAILIGRVCRLRDTWTAVLFAAAWSAISPSLLWLELRWLENDRFMEKFRQMDSPWFTVCKQGLEMGAFLLTLWLGLTLYASVHGWAKGSMSLPRLVRAMLLTVPLFLRASVAVAAVVFLLAAIFPKLSFGFDWHHTGFLQVLVAMVFSPASVVFFCTMVPSIQASLPCKTGLIVRSR